MGPRLLSRGELEWLLREEAGKPASMGPRLLSRGELPASDVGQHSQSGFNGAAASQPRREYLCNFNESKRLNRLLRAARSMFLLNAVVGPMQDS